MPRRPEHLVAAIVAGGASSLIRYRDRPSSDSFPLILGGVIGAALGGLFPDQWDLPSTPNHRSLAHSFTAVAVLGQARLTAWETCCEVEAARWRQRAATWEEESQQRAEAEFYEFLWKVVGGIAVGFVAGYVSHLALDAQTKRGLPLFL